MNHPLAPIPVLVLCLAGSPVCAQAETRSAAFGVSATVVKACRISAATLAFGSVEVLSGSNTDAASTLTTTCTAGSSFTIGLSAGSGAGATTGARKLTHAADSAQTLSYTVSAISPGGASWGGSGESGVANGMGTGSPHAIPVYGRIPAGQTAAAMGLYNDTLIATIDF